MIPSGENDKPTQDIILKDVIVHIDPFKDVMTELNAKDEKANEIRARKEERLAKDKLAKQARPLDKGKTEVGKYISVKRAEPEKAEPERPTKQSKKSAGRGFDFSSW